MISTIYFTDKSSTLPPQEKSCSETVKKVASFAYESFRCCVERLIMTALYPAQSSVLKECAPIIRQCDPEFSDCRTRELENYREQLFQDLKPLGFMIQELYLEKDGQRLNGLLIGKTSTFDNQKWVLQAIGSGESIEHGLKIFARTYAEIDYNVLLVNNPGIGKSEGFATPQTIGECQETAIRFLEEHMRAKKIILSGFCIGGAAIGQAILTHPFQQSSVDYLVIDQAAFSSVTEIVAHHEQGCLPKSFVNRVISWTDLEMDNKLSAEKLTKLGISQAIIHPEKDQMVPTSVSLWAQLQELGKKENQSFHSTGIGHNSLRAMVKKSTEIIQQWENGKIESDPPKEEYLFRVGLEDFPDFD